MKLWFCLFPVSQCCSSRGPTMAIPILTPCAVQTAMVHDCQFHCWGLKEHSSNCTVTIFSFFLDKIWRLSVVFKISALAEEINRYCSWHGGIFVQIAAHFRLKSFHLWKLSEEYIRKYRNLNYCSWEYFLQSAIILSGKVFGFRRLFC